MSTSGPAPRDRLRLLVLYAHYSPTLSYYDDWLGAFRAAPELDVTDVDLCRHDARARVAAAVSEHDAIVLLHSTNGDTLVYLEPVVGALEARRGPLAAFVGNEVNLPGSPIRDKIALLDRLGAEWIFTQLPLEAGEWLYAGCRRARVAAVPHALEPSEFRPERSDGNRDVDVGVRSARYTPYLGDDDRNRVLALFAARSFDPPLVVDVSTDERLPRDRWAAFLNRCRGTVSTEAGSWYLERDDATVDAIRAWVLDQQRTRGGLVIRADSPLRRLGHRLPWRFRAVLRRAMRFGPVRHEAAFNEDLDHAEIQRRFFAGRAQAPVYSKAISSRHFDAIGTRTCQILLRGRYNDILEADRHYLPLDQDFGNLGEVLRRFRDEAERRRIVEAAYEFAMSAHTYAHRISQVRELLSTSAPSRAQRGAAAG